MYQELDQLEDKFKKEICAKRKKLSESDLQALMAKYRQDQRALLVKRQSDKSRTDQLLKKKLKEKNRIKFVAEVNDSFVISLTFRDFHSVI